MDEAYADSLSTDYRWVGHSHFDSHPSAGDSFQLDSNGEDLDPSRIDRIGKIAELLDGLEEDQIHELVSGINDTVIQDKAPTNQEQVNAVNLSNSPMKENDHNLFQQFSQSQPSGPIFSNPSFPPPQHPVTFTSTPYKHVPAVSDPESYHSQQFFDNDNQNRNKNQKQKQLSFPSSHSTAISQTSQPPAVPSNPEAPSTQHFEVPSNTNSNMYQPSMAGRTNQPTQQDFLHEQEAHSPLYSNYPKIYPQHPGVPINRGNVHVESVHDHQEPTIACPPTSSTCVSTISQPPQSAAGNKDGPPVSQPTNVHLQTSPPEASAPASHASTIEVLPPALNDALTKMNSTIQSLTNQCQQRDKQIDTLTKQLLFKNQHAAPTVMPAILSNASGATNQRNMNESQNSYPRKPPAKQTRSVTVGNDASFPYTKPQGTVPNEIRVQLTTLDAILLQFDHLRKELSQARHEIQVLKEDASQAKGVTENGKATSATDDISKTDTSCNRYPENKEQCSHQQKPRSSVLQPIEVPNKTLNKSERSIPMVTKLNNDSHSPISHASKPLLPQDMPDSKFKLPLENQLYYRLGLHLIDRQCSIETANMLKSVLIQLDMPYTIFPIAIGQVRRQLQQGRRLYQWIQVVHYLIFHEKMKEGLVSKQCLSDLLRKLQEKLRSTRK
ncbi:SIN component scaffold protein Sid4 [Schizosaccharomyces cryophilus OY26]|uniref:SIN component scaffold protein Sid4 n=1 Tax=Schizosaccharomyces cryophilus (strain OY26 / ATCC MYA-4695 / CBS 11777 / NBRC 106824 / NRRL Y48691) TaxID=653667 RepID=S9W3J0_SCHCR|nr:SIN component scaffold protein Sid4 [Schizosaccharomyces cryophilus OY26]EPY52515.1 SIN component scaffold protein Sid4 [Schizosaccharomyces cryophilus OY26]